jgi:endo-1,4-beta-xylanase
MKLKRIVAVAGSLLALSSAVTVSAQDAKPNDITVIDTNFENGTTQGWAPRGHKGEEETVAVVNNAKHGGKAALKISNRQKTWHGPIQTQEIPVVAGDAYSMEAWAYFDEGPEEVTIMMSVERLFKDEKAPHAYANVTMFQLKKGEWKQIKTEYTVGADPTQKSFQIYFEFPYKQDDQVTANDKISFYLDDIVIKKLDPAFRPKVQQDIPNLAETYAGAFNVGCAVGETQVDPSSQQAQLLMKHFNLLVAGNAEKIDTVQKEEGKFNWGPADKIIEFAELTGMSSRWHVLVWHSQTPGWLFKDSKDPTKAVSKKDLNNRMKTYIQAVTKRYKGRISSYDVVNEVLNEDGTLRQSEWFKILGKDYIANAFKWAREGDPKVELIINDYNLESSKAKRQGMYNLVKELKAKKVPIDAIGMQMHISTTSPSVAEVKETIDLFASLGVRVVITELDMSIYSNDAEDSKPATKEILLLQAQKYKDLFTLFKDYAKKGVIKDVVIWGTTDDSSWKNDFPVKGRGDAPLLFDAKLKAKPAFWAVIDPSKVPGLK